MTSSVDQAGFRLCFSSLPPTHHLLRDTTTSHHLAAPDQDSIDQAFQSLRAKGAIEPVDAFHHHPFGFLCSMFVIPKKDGGRRPTANDHLEANAPVLNLKPLNQFLPQRPFNMETMKTICRMLRPGNYLTSIDLKDAFHHVPIHPSSWRFLRFQWRGRLFQYRVLPFGLSLSPWVFTKLPKPVLKWARRRGIHLTVYLDDLLMMAHKCNPSSRFTWFSTN